MRLGSSQHPTIRLYGAALLTPIERAKDAPWYADVVAFGVFVWQFLSAKPFAAGLFVLLAVNILDYLVGAAVAQKEGRWDAHVARAGAIGKGSAILLALVIRGIEGLVASAGMIDTHGSLAACFLVLQIVPELRSYDRNVEQLTGRATPGLRQILDFLDALATGALTSKTKTPKPEVKP